jgi:hypothetical protein
MDSMATGSLLSKIVIAAAWAAANGAPAMSIPILPEAADLAGRWVVTEAGSGTTCVLELTARPAGKGHVAITDQACLTRLDLADVSLWRPASDGIALAHRTGRTLAFFSKRGGCHVLRRAGRADLTLRRQ